VRPYQIHGGNQSYSAASRGVFRGLAVPPPKKKNVVAPKMYVKFKKWISLLLVCPRNMNMTIEGYKHKNLLLSQLAEFFISAF